MKHQQAGKESTRLVDIFFFSHLNFFLLTPTRWPHPIKVLRIRRRVRRREIGGNQQLLPVCQPRLKLACHIRVLVCDIGGLCRVGLDVVQLVGRNGTCGNKRQMNKKVVSATGGGYFNRTGGTITKVRSCWTQESTQLARAGKSVDETLLFSLSHTHACSSLFKIININEINRGGITLCQQFKKKIARSILSA